jgi:hypothetical protein
MNKKIFLQKLAKVLEVKPKNLETANLDDFENFDSLKQLELIAFYDKIIKDKKIIKKISVQSDLPKVLSILSKSKFFK